MIQMLVTQPMMEAYQTNELPEISELESLIEDYKKLIEKTKEYTSLEE